MERIDQLKERVQKKNSNNVITIDEESLMTLIGKEIRFHEENLYRGLSKKIFEIKDTLDTVIEDINFIKKLLKEVILNSEKERK